MTGPASSPFGPMVVRMGNLIRRCLIHHEVLDDNLRCPRQDEHPTPTERASGYSQHEPAPWWELWDADAGCVAGTVRYDYVLWEPGYEPEDQTLHPKISGREDDGRGGKQRRRRISRPWKRRRTAA